MAPHNAPRLLGAAAAHLKAGRPAEAIAPLQEAARLMPGDATIQHDLGLACLEAGRVAEAAAALRQAVAARPKYTDAWFRLGVALERLGEAGPAVAAYDRATELLPSHAEAWFRAGALVFTLGHRAEAIGCFRRAAATGAKTRFGRLGAVRALLAEDRDAEAETALRRLLALDPGNAMAHDLLGNLLADAGRFEAARESFARAIAQAPLMAGAYYDLVRCRPVRPEEAGLLPQMAAALAVPGLDGAQRLRVHLALGRAADDLGDPAQAMRHFGAADAVRREEMAAAGAAFDAAWFDAQVARIIARFPAGAMAAAGGAGADATPVLILGMPRSGTTLMEQILSSHPEVAACGELNFWNERGAAWDRDCAAHPQAAFVRQDFAEAAAADYLAVLRAQAPGAVRVTDKMPFNFLWAGLIHAAMPRATIIHCRRSAIDTALSIHQTHFNPRLAFPTGGAELVSYFRSYSRLMDHWRRVLPPARFIEVEYEALTAAPETVIPDIVTRAGLAWHDACLHPERNPRAVKTPSRWQARQGIYRSAVQRWRRYEGCLGALAALLHEDERRGGVHGNLSA